MKRGFLLSLVLTALAVAAAAQDYWPRQEVRDLKGRSRQLAEFASAEGATLFVFWKTCCPNNITMINELKEVWQEYDSAERPVKIVLVSLDDQRSASRVGSVVGSNGWPWEVIMDRNGDVARIYNAFIPPQWIAVDPKGKVFYQSKITNGALDSAIYFDELAARMARKN